MMFCAGMRASGCNKGIVRDDNGTIRPTVRVLYGCFKGVNGYQKEFVKGRFAVEGP